MQIEFTDHAWDDLEFWKANQPKIVIRIDALLDDISIHPFTGIGKPEPLRHSLKGFWSRRITGEHRLVYKITGRKGTDQKCVVIQCRFHYDS